MNEDKLEKSITDAETVFRSFVNPYGFTTWPAASAMEKLGAAGEIAVLRCVYDVDPDMRLLAVKCLDHPTLNFEPFVYEIAAMLGHEDQQLRKFIPGVLVPFGEKAKFVVGTLHSWLKDEDPAMRAIAAHAIARLDSSAKSRMVRLLNELADDTKAGKLATSLLSNLESDTPKIGTSGQFMLASLMNLAVYRRRKRFF